jgi:hypothetical protein
MRDNQKVVWVKFPTLSWAVFILSAIARHRQEWPHLELKSSAQGLFFNS